MKIHIEIDEAELKRMIVRRISEMVGVTDVGLNNVKIETKSKQNYRSEWESAAFRAIFDTDKA